MNEPKYIDVRCTGKKKDGTDCKGLLGLFLSGNGSIKCHRCGNLNNIYIVSQREQFISDMQPRSRYLKK